jgi:hypothetical protein
MPELRVGMPRTGNVLATMMQQRMREKEPQNVLAQAEVDALKKNPNYLNEKYATNAKRDKLQFEKDLVEYAVKKLILASSESYPAIREEMIGYGMSPNIWPQGFENKEAFDSWRKRVIMGTPEYLKMLAGREFTLSKLNDDGTISEVKVKSREEMEPYIEQGYQMRALKGTPDKPEYEHQTIYGPGGKTKRVSIKKGESYIPPEGWSLNKPGEDKTAWDQVTIYGPGGKTQRVSIKKGESYIPPEGWSLNKPGEDKAAQAYRRISDIYKAMATLGQTDSVTAALVALQPSLKGMIGQKIDANLKAQLDEAWNKEIAYLTQFVKAPEEGPGPEIPPDGARGTYNGKAVVVRQGKWVYAD